MITVLHRSLNAIFVGLAVHAVINSTKTILKIFEIYHWNETSQFNRETGESGLFAETNIFIAAFTTCWARLKLFSLLEMLDRRVLYFDTDSVIFVSRVGDKDPETGSFLGELTNELKKPGDFITGFVSGGPKNYAFKTLLGEQVCKVKGFSFNYKNSKLINFSSMLQLVSNPREKIVNSVKKLKLKKRKRKDRQSENEVNKVVVTNERKITRQKLKRKLYNRVEQKEYRIVYDKRVLQKDSFDTLPYGY